MVVYTHFIYIFPDFPDFSIFKIFYWFAIKNLFVAIRSYLLEAIFEKISIKIKANMKRCLKNKESSRELHATF